MDPVHRFLAVLVVAAACAVGVIVLATPGPAGADLTKRIDSSASRAEKLRAAVAAESARIRASAPALAAAHRRLATIQAQTSRHKAQLQAIETALVRARNRLTVLIDRQRRATGALRDNLVSSYRDPDPDIVAVILTAHGFSDLLEKADFLKRIARQNARIMDAARTSKVAVTKQTNRLAKMQTRQREVALELERKRDKALTLQTALLRAQRSRVAARATNRSELQEIQRQLAALREKLARSARNNIATNPGGQAQAPPGAPTAVQLVIAAGNAIAGLPYLYGGGHAGFKDTAYDCSGSISYALASAGLVSSPMASGGFMSWGMPGQGKWITVYANSGHAFMVVAGWRFDTSALRSGGTRWTRSMRPTGGFVARHPPGL
ncbi:MAG: coiled-coil domain-containing protein [Solirubrobacteraceae bacterium]